MNSLSLPYDIQNQTLIYNVSTPLARGKLELKVERKSHYILLSGRTELKALGGLVTPLSAHLRVNWQESQGRLIMTEYQRELKILKVEKDANTNNIPEGAIDHVSLIFGLKYHFESHGNDPAQVRIFDGRKTADITMKKSNDGKISIGRNLERVEILVDNESNFVSRIGYNLAGLGRIDIQLERR